MINRPLKQIDLADLEQLQSNAVAEGKTIEYKQKLPTDSDRDKKEFLADISSFANTSGGDLIYGITEKDGTPKSIDGVEVGNVDETIRKYESIIRAGIEPRIACSTHTIKLANNKLVFIFRISKSWLSPHRVIYQKHGKFHSRHSAGKYSMDTAELRTAFTLSQTLTEQITKFKTERITQIYGDNLPVPFEDGAKIALHLIPLESFSPNYSIDLKPIIHGRAKLNPINIEYALNLRITFEGVLLHECVPKASSYVQLYRKGICEAVVQLSSSHTKGDQNVIPNRWFEGQLLKSLGSYLNLAKDLGINTPIAIFLTLIGVKNWKISDDKLFYRNGHNLTTAIDRNILELPESIVESYATKPQEILRPMFDRVWNACGREQSPNFDEDGNWIENN